MAIHQLAFRTGVRENSWPSRAAMDFSARAGRDFLLRVLFALLPGDRPDRPKRNPPRRCIPEHDQELRRRRLNSLVRAVGLLARLFRRRAATRLLDRHDCVAAAYLQFLAAP